MITKTINTHKFSAKSCVQELEKRSPLSINQIKDWLVTYQSRYQYCEDNWRSYSCCGGLPCGCTRESEEYKFIYIYKSLVDVTEEHLHEDYFRNEMEVFETITEPSEMLKWLSKNEKLGGEKYVSFIIDHLDYSDNPIDLIVFVLTFSDSNIYVKREEFKNTITFLETFNKYYWPLSR